MIQIKQGDCLELMKEIPNGSIDMVLCDLPYGITRNVWDCCIDLKQLWKEYKRVIKKDGAIVLFSAEPFTATLIKSNEKLFRYDLIWSKNKGSDFLNANRKPLRSHENILVFYQKTPTYNAQMVQGEPYKARSGPTKSKCYSDFNSNWHTGNPSGLRYPLTVLSFPMQNNKNKQHPTQKPVSLCEYLIKTYTNVGDTVLDNCMGVGSAGVAACKCGRNFIGFELDEKYFQIAAQRIGEVMF